MLQMYWYGERPFSVLSLRPKLQAVTKSAGGCEAGRGFHSSRRPLSVSTGVNPIRRRRDQVFQEACGGWPIGLLMQRSGSKLGGSIDRHEEAELTLLGANLDDVDVEIADCGTLKISEQASQLLEITRQG
jgi:hypothetical protein